LVLTIDILSKEYALLRFSVKLTLSLCVWDVGGLTIVTPQMAPVPQTPPTKLETRASHPQQESQIAEV